MEPPLSGLQLDKQASHPSLCNSHQADTSDPRRRQRTPTSFLHLMPLWNQNQMPAALLFISSEPHGKQSSSYLSLSRSPLSYTLFSSLKACI